MPAQPKKALFERNLKKFPRAKFPSRAKKIIARLQKAYPDNRCALVFRNPLELLIATMLSAQCTDARVNKVTPMLFKRFPDANAYASADVKEVETYVRPTGFYRQKAKNIQAACRMIAEKFHGKVPSTMEELITLPGVARKTANVILFVGFKKNLGVTVDTHVSRLAARIGFSRHDNPNKIEQNLMRIVPRNEWGDFSLLLIRHGREVCTARKPNCGACVIADLCPAAGTFS